MGTEMDSAKPVDAPKRWDPTPHTIKLEATTDLPSLALEISRQMQRFGERHTKELPYEVTCTVRVVFKDKVSKDGIRRLLEDANANMWGFAISCHDGDGEDE